MRWTAALVVAIPISAAIDELSTLALTIACTWAKRSPFNCVANHSSVPSDERKARD